MESFIITLIKKHILDFYDDFVLKEEENKEETTTSLLFDSVTTEWLCVDQQTVHRTIIPGQNSIEKKHVEVSANTNANVVINDINISYTMTNTIRSNGFLYWTENVIDKKLRVHFIQV